MAVGQVYRLSVVGGALDQTIVNTFHFLQTGTPGGGRSPADDILFRWTAGPTGSPNQNYALMLPSSYLGRELVVLNTADPLDNSSQQNAIPGGRGGGQHLPPQCCGLLSLETQGRGRSFRGRTYIGPVLEQDQDAGTITTTYSDALARFAQSVATSYNSTPWAWVVYSRKLRSGQPVTRVHIRLFIATQRRRSRYNPG